jgi:GNAT superfamily N-acetyltransferase
MDIRRITPDDDAAAAGRIVQEAYFRLPGYPRDDEYDARLGDVAGRVAEADVVVAVDDGRIVACLTFVPEMTGPHAEFDDADATSFRYFGVDPSVQGRGVGDAMVRWVIDESRRLGRRRIRIHTLESMPGAQRLYERMGFVRTPELDEDWDGIRGIAFAYEL